MLALVDRALSQELFYLVAEPPHDLVGLADIPFTETDAQSRGGQLQLGVLFQVARFTFRRKLHKLRALVFWIVDEFHEPIRRKLTRQPLHALTARRPHLGDLRHGKRTKQREASQEAERATAPAGDEPCFLTESPYPEEALSHFEHQLSDRLPFAVGSSFRRFSLSRRRHFDQSICFDRSVCPPVSRLTPSLSILQNDTIVVI